MKKAENAGRLRRSGFYKAAAAFLCLVLLLCGCSGQTFVPEETTAAEPVKMVTLRAPRSASDSMNPFYSATSMNACLAALAYEGLFALNTDLSPKPVLAASFTESDKSVRVILPASGVFQDGTALTSVDVVYSFQMAKKSSVYSGSLASVSQAMAASPLEVVFSYTDSLSGAVQLLTFPIVKNKTADQADSIPVGTGKFRMEKDGNTFRFVRTAGAGEAFGQVETVETVPVTDSEKLMYGLQTGEIDFFCSDLYGERISRSSAKMVYVPRNNMVFLGMNANAGLCGNEDIRRAISLAVNREEIAESVYSSAAVASFYPIRPGSRLLESLQTADQTAAVDYDTAENLLKQLGFTTVQVGTGIRSGNMGTLSLTLLVNSESGYRRETAVCIQNSLAKVGIGVQIKSLDYESYTEALQSGSYDLYLGEIRLPENGSLASFFGGNASWGIPSDGKCCLAYREVMAGTVSLASFITDFASELPFLPLCFRNDVLVCREKITVPEGTFLFGDCFSNIEQWRIQEEKASEEGSTDTP